MQDSQKIQDSQSTSTKLPSSCDVLVIDGKSYIDCAFYNVGSHHLSDFKWGSELYYFDYIFSRDIKRLVGSHRFKAIIFGCSIKDWRKHSDCICGAINTLLELLVPNGFVMFEYIQANGSTIDALVMNKTKMHLTGVVKYGKPGFTGSSDVSVIYTFDGNLKNIELTDTSDIHSPSVLESFCHDIVPSHRHLSRQYNWYNQYRSVDEVNQTTFMRRRLIRTPIRYSSIHEPMMYITFIKSKLKFFKETKIGVNERIIHVINMNKGSRSFPVEAELLCDHLYWCEQNIVSFTAELLNILAAVV